LFDLNNDIREERNLSDESSHETILKTWRQRLVRRLADRPEGFSQNGRLVAGRPYRALNAGTLDTTDSAR